MTRIWSTIPLLGLLFLLGSTLQAVAEPLSLEQCVERAFAHSRSLQSEQAKVRGAEAKVREARANRLPNVNVSASYTYAPWLPKSVLNIELPEGDGSEEPADEEQPAEEEQPANGEEDGDSGGGFPFPSGPIEIEAGAHHTGVVGASLEQPVFTWGKIGNGIGQAEASLEAVREGFRAAKHQLQLDVTEGFYGVLLAQEFVLVTERALEQVERHRGIAQTLVETGAATRFDLLRAEVQLANVKSQLIRAENGLELAKESLKLLLSMPTGEAIEVQGDFEAQPAERPLAALTQAALEQRPELRGLAYQELAGDKLVRIAKAGNKPNLALVSNYQFMRTDQQTSGNHGFNVTLALSIPVFDGFKTRAQARQAEMGLEQIQLGRAQLEDGVRLEVKAAYLNLHQASALLEAQEETVGQAAEGLRIANLQYENGMITSVELTDTELAHTQAEVNRLQSLHDYVVAQARLQRAVGSE